MKADKKDTILRIRISTQDKNTILANATKKQKTISTYVRDASLNPQSK
jgi:hypothetical protein